MPTAEWWIRENYRLAMQYHKYQAAIKQKRMGLKYLNQFELYNNEEHKRQQYEEEQLEQAIHTQQAKEEAARLTTVAMLLDANYSYSNDWFEKVVGGSTPQGMPYHWTHYYDRNGVEINPKTRMPI